MFALNFLKHPLSVGSFLQSSPALVRRLLDGVDWSRCRTVVELGPGVGTISGELLARLHEDARLLLIESNADFIAELRADLRDPRVRVIHGSALDLARILADEGVTRVDVVVSGIPFSTLRAEARGTVLDAVSAALHPDGHLLVYQHSGRVLPLLQRRFATVTREIEWRNPVPMRLFRCREPREETLASSG